MTDIAAAAAAPAIAAPSPTWRALKRKATTTAAAPLMPGAVAAAAPPAPPECPSCHEYLLEPHMFRCAHHLCAPCTANLLLAEHASENDGRVRCPLCRVTSVPRAAREARDWLAAWFPDEQARAQDERADRSNPLRLAAAIEARIAAAAGGDGGGKVTVTGTIGYTDSSRVLALQLVDGFLAHVASVTCGMFGRLPCQDTVIQMWCNYVQTMPRLSSTYLVLGTGNTAMEAGGRSAHPYMRCDTCYIRVGSTALFIFHAANEPNAAAPINFAH